jgi:hypothetical protein
VTRTARIAVAALAAGALAALLVVLRLLDQSGTALPRAVTFCFLREVAGLPCPLCGGTRALLALAAGRPGAALAANPLVAIAAMAMLAAPLLVILPGVERIAARLRRAARPAILLAVLVLDWAWVIARHAG